MTTADRAVARHYERQAITAEAAVHAIAALHTRAVLTRPRTRDDKRLYKALGWRTGEEVCNTCDENWPCRTSRILGAS